MGIRFVIIGLAWCLGNTKNGRMKQFKLLHFILKITRPILREQSRLQHKEMPSA